MDHLKRMPLDSDASRRSGSRVSALLPALILVAGLLLPSTGFAQAFGQWWWSGTAGVEQRSRRNERGGAEVNRYETSSLELDAALHGFVLHPAIGEFRLDIEALLSEFEGARLDASDRLGAGLELTMLPRSSHPLRLFYGRRLFDYTQAENLDSEMLFDDPDSVTEWGASWSAGDIPWLKGLAFGLRRSAIDYLGPQTRQGHDDNDFLTWERTSSWRHRLVLRRNRKVFGTRDYETESLSALLNESGGLRDGGNWSVNASAYRLENLVTGTRSEGEDYRLSALLSNTIGRTDRLDTRVDFDATRLMAGAQSTEVSRNEGFGLRSAYRWRLRPSFEISPFVQYSERSGRELSDSGAGFGLGFLWNRALGSAQSTLNGNYLRGKREVRSGAASETADFDSMSLTQTLVHGRPGKLKKEIELSYDRGAFIRDSRDAGELIEFGLASTARDISLLRTRAVLSTQRPGSSKHLRLDWTSREDAGDAFGPGVASETLSASAQYSRGRIGVSAQIGETDTDRDPLPAQRLLFSNLGLNWQLGRSLRLTLSYREDERETLLSPALVGEAYEARAAFRVGQLSFEGRLFETTREFAGDPERRNRGFEWSIRRRFATLLPFISSPERRGTIR